MEKLGDYQVILDDIMSGNIDESSISTIFSKLNLSMVSGAVLGAATIALLNNYLSKKNIKVVEYKLVLTIIILFFVDTHFFYIF